MVPDKPPPIRRLQNESYGQTPGCRETLGSLQLRQDQGIGFPFFYICLVVFHLLSSLGLPQSCLVAS